jgi:hypothetical protein
VHVVAGGDEQGERVEPGHRLRPLRVVAQGEAGGRAVVDEADAAQDAVLGELDVGPEAQHALVPLPAGGHVAHRELDVVDSADHGAVPRFRCSSTLELDSSE